MKKKWLIPTAILLLTKPLMASEVQGQGDIGLWYLHNNLNVADDGVGDNHIFSDYSLMFFGLKLDATDLTEDRKPFELNAHFKGKLFLKLTDGEYTLGFNQRTRQEIDELNIEAKKVWDFADIWFGRQQVYEAGGAMFDGIRLIHSLNDRVDIALYGGLDADPRQLTGYIGPAYESVPFSVDFQTVGVYSTYRGDSLKTDAAFRSEFYKGGIDRVSLYSQASYQLNAFWTFSGLFDADVAGDPGFKNLSAYITSRPVPSVTNTLSFTRWTALQYAASDASAIPPPATVSTGTIGTEVNSTSYNVVRDHIMFKIFERNYVFTAFQFARRTFDNVNQYKYTIGYRDPRLFGAAYDLRIQTDLINNYRGFNTAFDGLFGKEWNDGEFRLEGGGTMYANERETFPDTSQPRQTESEFSFRLNSYYNPMRALSWVLQYALYRETDVVNNSQKVNTHEVYLTSSFRF